MKRYLCCFLLLWGWLTTSYAQPPLPGQSAKLLPLLVTEINTYWSTLPKREFPAGVIDQESNWNPKARLKTSREFGCGLGQFTVAYNARGSVRFDALDETKHLDRSLSAWNWKDCYAVEFQLRAVVLKLKTNDRGCDLTMKDTDSRLACGAAKYNGGAGSVATRIRYCRASPGCDAGVWFNNLERQCPQARTKVAGYGESFCEINSKYPGRVFTRMKKFVGYM